MSLTSAPPLAQPAEAHGVTALARRGRFAEALARAGRNATERRATGAPRPGGTMLRNPSPHRVRREAGAAREAFAETCLAEAAPAGAPQSSQPGIARVDVQGAAELRACICAIPPAVAASLRHGGAELALSFGPALSLDLRAGAQGLELTLRPTSGLERVTRAELPGLIDALRAQGFRVARAEVRARAPPTPRRAR
jgi:hypothetical protein